MIPAMMRVYSGTRPGRPVLLTLMSAGALVATLAAAGWQVREARRLGDELPIPGTPLRVRVPSGWIRDRQHPGRFLAPVDHPRARSGPSLRRSLLFTYDPTTSIGDVERLALERSRPGVLVTAAKVGPFDAVQIVYPEVLRIFRREFRRELVLRIANLPWGGVVTVEYTPLARLETADLDLFDSVCRAVRVAP